MHYCIRQESAADLTDESVHKTNLVFHAYSRLKGDILAARIVPGFQATELEFASRLGMSRTPVREALLRLESDGLVELIPRRGARVLPTSIADIREIYEVLTALEPEAAASLASRKERTGLLMELEAATEQMERAVTRGDLDAWASADDRFHRQLLALSKNQRMINFVNRLFDQAHRVRLITLRLRPVPEKSTGDHRQILSHIKSGDADAARRCFRSHRKRAAEELLGILQHYRLPSL